MAREQGQSVHIVLIEFAGNDNIADVQGGIDSIGHASKNDLVDAELSDEMRYGRGGGYFTPARKYEDYRHTPESATMIGAHAATSSFA